MRFSALIAGTVLSLAIAPASAQNKTVKIGFVSTFTGPTAAMGVDARAGFELALDHLGRKLGGLPVEVVYEDDQQKPDVAKQKTEKLVQSDKVDFLVGYIWSNGLLASLKTANDSETFLIGTNAGPSQIAGPQCSPFFFSTSWQNDQIPQALGLQMNQKGTKTAYMMAPNYAAGRDMVAGVKSTFKGAVLGEDYTKFPDQLDFSAELAKLRAAKPEAVFVFYSAAATQFLSQYSQAGLLGHIPLYTMSTADELTLPLHKDLALGVIGAQQWVQDLPNEQNKKFVADYRAKNGDRRPAPYASQSYDAAFLIDSAVASVKGNLSSKDAVRAALRKADFKSVRGPFKFGNNHFPIQDFYIQEVVKGPEGDYVLKTVNKVVENSQDRFHDKCPMSW